MYVSSNGDLYFHEFMRIINRNIPAHENEQKNMYIPIILYIGFMKASEYIYVTSNYRSRMGIILHIARIIVLYIFSVLSITVPFLDTILNAILNSIYTYVVRPRVIGKQNKSGIEHFIRYGNNTYYTKNKSRQLNLNKMQSNWRITYKYIHFLLDKIDKKNNNINRILLRAQISTQM